MSVSRRLPGVARHIWSAHIAMVASGHQNLTSSFVTERGLAHRRSLRSVAFAAASKAISEVEPGPTIIRAMRLRRDARVGPTQGPTLTCSAKTRYGFASAAVQPAGRVTPDLPLTFAEVYFEPAAGALTAK